MTDEKRQREDIERDEQWLAGVCERSTEIDTGRIKRAVRITVEEQWFRGNIPSDVPAGLPGRVRRVIQETLADTPVGAGNQVQPRVIRLWGWVGGGLAAAAAIGLLVVGSWKTPQPSHTDDAGISFAAAFEEFQDNEELDQELDRLRDSFSVLDQWSEDPWEEPIDETSDPTEDGV